MDHSLQELMPVERLLFLKQEDIRGHGNTTDGLAMGWSRPWAAVVVGVIQSIVFPLAARSDSGYLRCQSRRAVVQTLEDGGALEGSWICTGCASKLLHSLNRMCHDEWGLELFGCSERRRQVTG